MGSSLLGSLRGYQEISHKTSSPSGSHIRETFLLYVKAMDQSLGALLAQKDDNGHKYAVYSLSRTLIGTESRYNPIEKECLALVFVVQKHDIIWSAKPYMSFPE